MEIDVHQDPPFWLVWNEQAGCSPRFKHHSEESAETEARRLANLNPGQPYTVLAPVTRITAASVIVERFDASPEVPF